MIDQFLRALQKNRSSQSEAEDSTDEPPPSSTMIKKSINEMIKKKLSNNNSGESATETELTKNTLQSNSKKLAKRNSVPKVESNL